MQTEPILTETIASIQDILGADLDRITVERAVVGLFFTGVKLDTGVTGACATPLRSIPDARAPLSRKLRGRLAGELLKEATAPSGIRRAVGIATMNALADMCWERRPTAGVDLCTGVNAYDAAEIRAGESVVVVGAFVPFLKSLKRTHQRFTVLEIDSATLKLDELPHFRPANEAASVVPGADVVLITGTTLLNNTLENLLALCQPKARVVLVGPTVGLLPDAFLRRGVDVLGGVRVTAPDAFLDVLMEGGSAYHFFGRSAEKVVLMRRAATRKIASGVVVHRPSRVDPRPFAA
jgi:uncharacterized protein (DUF4213/DUF364 family)